MPVTTSKPRKPRPKADQATEFAAAIKAALLERDGDATKLHRVAQTLVALAIEGNMPAIKEISERLDGKAGAQQSGASAANAPSEPIEVRVKWLKS